MAGLQSAEDRMMLDSVVWAQYINVTDTQTDRHVSTEIAAPTHYVWRQKLDKIQHQNVDVYIVYDMPPPAPTLSQGSCSCPWCLTAGRGVCPSEVIMGMYVHVFYPGNFQRVFPRGFFSEGLNAWGICHMRFVRGVFRVFCSVSSHRSEWQSERRLISM